MSTSSPSTLARTKPCAGEVLEQRLVLALAAADHRREHLEPGAVGQLEDAVDDLLRRLALQAGAVVGAVLDADARVQQAQVVVDLGDRADRGPRVAAGRLLVDRDGRRQPLDDVDVGLVHLPEELAGVRAEALDVAALALGVDGVERQAALARPGQAGEHDQPVARQVDADVLEVVLAGAAHDDLAGVDGGHQRSRLPTERPAPAGGEAWPDVDRCDRRSIRSTIVARDRTRVRRRQRSRDVEESLKFGHTACR